MDTGNRTGTVYGLLTALFFGVGAVLAKYIVGYLDPLLVAFLDLSLGFAFLTPFLLVKRVSLVRGLDKKSATDLLLASSIGLALPLLAILYGLRTTSAIEGGALIQLQTWGAIIFSVAFLKERLTLRGFSGVVLAALGGLAVSLRSFEGGLFGDVTIGDGLVFMGAIGLGYGFIPTRKLAQNLGGLRTAALRLLLGGILLGPALVLFSNWPLTKFSITLPIILALATYTFTNFSLAYLTLHEGLRLLTAWRVASLMQAIPLFSSFFAILILGERLTWLQVIGMLFIIGGNLMIERSRTLT